MIDVPYLTICSTFQFGTWKTSETFGKWQPCNFFNDGSILSTILKWSKGRRWVPIRWKVIGIWLNICCNLMKSDLFLQTSINRRVLFLFAMWDPQFNPYISAVNLYISAAFRPIFSSETASDRHRPVQQTQRSYALHPWTSVQNADHIS